MASRLPPNEIEARLRAFYDLHNPGNQQNIAEIVRKYHGKESVLCAKLQKKYGTAPILIPANDTTVAHNATTTNARPTVPIPAARIPTKVPAYDPHYTVVRVVLPTQTVGDAALDFQAPTFDARRALEAPSLLPPVRGLTPLDNIHKCRHLLPATDPNYQPMVLLTAKKPTKATATAAPADGTAPTRTPLLFEALADTYLDGPFTLLRRCFLERTRVCVVVRRVNSVRGTLRGFLKAFDKHMNLVLLDVQQHWIPPQHYAGQDRAKRLVRDGGSRSDDGPVPLLSIADERRNRGFTTNSYAKQLFVRGDNVVMVLHDTGNGTKSTTTTPSSSSRHATSAKRRDYAPVTQRS